MKKKTFLGLLCILILGTITVIGTYAYQLFKQDPITNTYVIGDVNLELNQVNTISGGKETYGNTYQLRWNTKYQNEVGVDVKNSSEASHAFILMENDLALVESETIESTLGNQIPEDEVYDTIVEQAETNGWTLFLTSGDYVKIFYKELNGNQSTAIDSYPFISEFRTKDKYESSEIPVESPKMMFTLYAIEKGSLTKEEAWNYLKEEFADDLGTYTVE